jgi:uncharacterized protein (TIGR01777 family)
LTKKTILIAGGTGLVGSRIIEMLPKEEFIIHILTRQKKPDRENIRYFEWDIANGQIDLDALKVDYIINLTGAGIADKRWTNSRKKIIIDSRVESLNLIGAGLEKLNHKPKMASCASAIGYYGDRGTEILTEESSPGTGFLPHSCKLWESASNQLIKKCERGVVLRIGIVLSKKGGALPKILMTSKLGVLNYFGDGSQYYSYIHIDDLADIFIQSLKDKSFSGVINAVSPNPLQNKSFTKNIADALPGNQVALPAPAFALKLALGEMSAVVLDSSRVMPTKLQEIGYEFNFAEVEAAIKDIMKREV